MSATARGLLWALALSACASQPPARDPPAGEPPPDRPAVAPVLPPSARDAAAPDREASEPVGTVNAPPAPEPVEPTHVIAPAADGGGVEAPGARVLVEVEKPYKLFERPRPRGEVRAAGHDEQLGRWNVGGTGDPDFISSRPSFHPGARVVVDASVLNARLPRYARRSERKRALSQWTVTTIARKYGYWPFRICFEDGLRKKPRMKGQTIARVSFGTDGRVTAARLVSTKLEERTAADCIVDRIRTTPKLRLAPAPRKRLDVELSVKLWPGDAPVPETTAPDPDTWQNPGDLDVDALDEAMRPVRDAVRDCYRRALENDPALWGRLALRVSLDDDGKPPRCADCARADANCRVRCGAPKEFGSRFPDRTVVRCAERAIAAVELGEPPGGAVAFVYAFRLGRMPSGD